MSFVASEILLRLTMIIIKLSDFRYSLVINKDHNKLRDFIFSLTVNNDHNELSHFRYSLVINNNDHKVTSYFL